MAVLSASDKEERVRLPLGAVGACGLAEEDVMGQKLSWRRLDENSVEMTVPAGTCYFAPCRMKEK